MRRLDSCAEDSARYSTARSLVATHVGTLDVEFPNLRDSPHPGSRLFRLSPRRRGEDWGEGFAVPIHCGGRNPHPSLPLGEELATGTRAQGRFDFAQLTH